LLSIRVVIAEFEPPALPSSKSKYDVKLAGSEGAMLVISA
jgi:hypothetical protein